MEVALKLMAEDNACVKLENFVVSGKSRIMGFNVDRTRLLKELWESKHVSELSRSIVVNEKEKIVIDEC